MTPHKEEEQPSLGEQLASAMDTLVKMRAAERMAITVLDDAKTAADCAEVAAAAKYTIVDIFNKIDGEHHRKGMEGR